MHALISGFGDMIMVQLMAPGGTREMAIAALDHGADSVFVGPRGWSRRPRTDELTDAELFDVIDFGVATGKDVRVAINVMPSPQEIPQFLRKIEQVAHRGAQGVMLCDPGCIALVRQQFPELEIHVSVTAGVFNLEDINLYAQLGADIVVIPYRWGVDEIEQIRDAAGMQLEAFMFQPPQRSWVCPGRCYSSSYFHIHHKADESQKDQFIGSASRGGSCHRICRSDWAMMQGATKAGERHVTHREDLKASPELLLWELPLYLEMGVSRLKIPGRERSIPLVCAIVSLYRRAVDQILAGNRDMRGFEEEWRQIKGRWNREKRKRDSNQIDLALS